MDLTEEILNGIDQHVVVAICSKQNIDIFMDDRIVLNLEKDKKKKNLHTALLFKPLVSFETNYYWGLILEMLYI